MVIFCCCWRISWSSEGVFYGPVPFGRTEDCGTEDYHSWHAEAPSWLQVDHIQYTIYNISEFVADIIFPCFTNRSNFDSTPPPILIDAGVAVLENEKIERYKLKEAVSKLQNSERIKEWTIRWRLTHLYRWKSFERISERERLWKSWTQAHHESSSWWPQPFHPGESSLFIWSFCINILELCR